MTLSANFFNGEMVNPLADLSREQIFSMGRERQTQIQRSIYWFTIVMTRFIQWKLQLALVHFMVLGSQAPWAPKSIIFCWAPEMTWAPIASKFLFGGNGSPTNFGSPADIAGVGSPGRPYGGGG